MPRSYRKNILRTFRSTKSRFLAIFSIVALGVGFLAGLMSTTPDMKDSMEAYLDGAHLYDLRVVSTLGLTDEDVAALQAVEGVGEVQPAYSLDLLVAHGEDTLVARAHSLPADPAAAQGLNRLTLLEGRWPVAPGECVVCSNGLALGSEWTVGESFAVSAENENTEDALARTQFTVVGRVRSPLYFSLEREAASVGNGTVSMIFFILPSDFSYEAYTEIYLSAAEAVALPSLEDGYSEAVQQVEDRIEAISETRAQARYDQLRADAQAEIDDGWADYNAARAEAEQELADAARELEDGRREIADGEAELADGEAEYRDGLATLADNEQQIADAIQMMDAVRAQLVEGQAAYDEGWRQLEEGQAQLDAAYAQLTEGQAAYDAGKRAYDEALAQLEAGEAQLAEGRAVLEENQRLFDESERQYEEGRRQYEDGLAQLAAQGLTLESARAQYEQLCQLNEGEKAYREGIRQLTEQLNARLPELGIEEPLHEEQVDEVIGELAARPAEELPQDPVALVEMLLARLGAVELTPDDATAARSALQTLLDELYTIPEEERTPEAQRLIGHLEELTALDDEALLARMQALLDALAGLPTDQLPAEWQALRDRLRQLLEENIPPEQQQELQALADGLRQLIEGRRQLDAGLQAIMEAQGVDEAAARALYSDEALAELDDQLTQLEAAGPQLEEAKAQLEAGRTQLQEGWATYEANAARLADGRVQLAASLPQLEEAKAQLEYGWAQYEEQGSAFYAGRNQLLSSRQTLLDGWAQLTNRQSELDDAQRQIADARTTLADAARELEDGRRELDEAVQKLRDGELDYEEARAEVEAELADAENKLYDAQAELDKLEKPTWYIWDRSANTSFHSFDGNVSKVEAIARVFPVFFFLVAALVVSTTMTRMVEEERLQIGTMKALGYANGAILQKYIWYALTAAASGALVGLAFGFVVFPSVIAYAYGMMYAMPPLATPWRWNYALMAGGLLIGCALVTTWSAGRATLREVPADLMRPRAPKAGKRILLERIRPLWRRLPFTYKVTCRNLLRYKKRFWMTVIGVAGCTALLVTGFGIADSLNAIAIRQYGEIFDYDLMTAVMHSEDALQGEVHDYLFGDAAFTQSLVATTELVNQTMPDGSRSEVYLMTPQDAAAFAAFADLHERVSRSPTPLTEDGVVLTEKLAAAMGVRAGDTVTLENSDGAQATFTVTGVCEHYVMNYAYIGAQAYQQGFGKEPAWNTILSLLARENDSAEKDAVSARLLGMDAVASVNFTADQRVAVLNMLRSINAVVVLIIVCAACLALVVLYNLTNINIAERVKEIATIKVLGFYDREVSAYVNRESVLLSIIGALLGLVGGIALHRFVIYTVEVDAVMFGRDILPRSFLYALLLTMLFSTAVDLIMGRRLRRISMVESMKAPE